MGRRERMQLNLDHVVSLMLMMLLIVTYGPAPSCRADVDLTRRGESAPSRRRPGRQWNRPGAFVEDATSASPRSASFKHSHRSGRQGIYLRSDAGVPYGSVVQYSRDSSSGIADVGLVATIGSAIVTLAGSRFIGARSIVDRASHLRGAWRSYVARRR